MIDARVRVAAVLPCRGQRSLLEGALEALRSQSRPADEVVVVDDSPNGEIGQLDGVRVLGSGGRGPYAARNIGWRATDADVLLFLDARSRPRPDWVERTVALFDDPAVAIAGSEVVVRSGPSLAERAAELHQVFQLWRYIDEPFFRPYVPTCNLAVRRGDLEAIGGFNEARSGADAELCWRVLERPGRRLETLSEALMEWVPRDRVREYLEQSYRYGRTHYRLRRAWEAAGAEQRPPMSWPVLIRRLARLAGGAVRNGLVGGRDEMPQRLRSSARLAYQLGYRVAADADEHRGRGGT